MAERPPITDFRGGRGSESSSSRLVANLVVASAVDFQLSGAGPVSTA